MSFVRGGGGMMLLPDMAECAMTAFIMAVVVMGACMFMRRRMPWGPAVVQVLLLLVLVPGMAGVLWLPHWGGAAGNVALWPVLQGVFVCPLVTVLPLRALMRVPASVSRTAWGLGAGPWMRARLLWLPLLGPSLVLSACAGLGMGVLAAMVDMGATLGT
ncbi:hypothetical protein [Novacetimonas hansenii]|uniref:Uncharacterized protein n=1 Tax=Novacetimonas hansenii TaxID=436 RepID=A0AAW5ETZ4_NOVHA|nr:hypothetical protein [Novacetimonas hansenii]MCJ8354785.1 hypothetical protein [Novacetimonas hansenii]WEQ58216.1 hypothetical protein LV563_10075 [Novacetimonas hansenii]